MPPKLSTLSSKVGDIIFISGELKDRATKATNDEHIDISELREEANTVL